MPTLAQGEFPPPRSWDEFEDIVADLYKRIWNDPNATRYGRSGQAQQGVDVYGQPERLEGGYAGVQCKRYERGTLKPTTVEQEIAKAEQFTPPLAEYIIATTDRLDTKVQKAVRQINEERRARLRAELDALYGHLYGLTGEELAYILDTFPIVRRKDEAAYGEYRTNRLILEAYEEVESLMR
jgi:hypothetical protein